MNGAGLSTSNQNSALLATVFGRSSVVLSDLSSTSEFRVRVGASNRLGLGAFRMSSNPVARMPAYTVPATPELVEAELVSSTEIGVSFEPPSRDGGAEVTLYRVQVSSQADFSGAAPAEAIVPASSGAPGMETLVIRSSFNSSVGRSGAFNVYFRGQQTRVPWNADRREMQAALAEMPALGGAASIVSVDRHATTYGYTWTIVVDAQNVPRSDGFGTSSATGNVLPGRTGRTIAGDLTVDSDAGSDEGLYGDSPSLAVGARAEVQQMTCTSTLGSSDTIDLSLLGYTVTGVSVDSTLDEFQAILAASAGIGDGVEVTLSDADSTQTTICAAATPTPVLITFGARAGDLPLVQVDASTAGVGSVVFTEIISGDGPFQRAQTTFRAVVSDLDEAGITPGASVYVRVQARNAEGYSEYAVHTETRTGTPAIVVTDNVPQPVTGPVAVSAIPSDPTRLLVQWSEPSSSGGSAITGFEVEASRTPTFDGSCGDFDEVQRV